TDGQPKARVEDLVKHINENPDFLHGDYTPAVWELIKIGLPSLKYGVLELLLSNNPEERIRAERVLTGVSMEVIGLRLGSGPKDPSLETKWRDLWKANGSYDWSGSAESRGQSVIKWRQWVLSQR